MQAVQLKYLSRLSLTSSGEEESYESIVGFHSPGLAMGMTAMPQLF